MYTFKVVIFIVPYLWRSLMNQWCQGYGSSKLCDLDFLLMDPNFRVRILSLGSSWGVEPFYPAARAGD